MSSSSLPILTVDRVAPPPNRPYPPPGVTIPLSFLDTSWIHLPYVQPLFLYPETSLPFSSIIQSLKSSLSTTLLNFHPLAGKLTYLPSSADVIIDCSDPGVDFIVVAECDGDIKRLASDLIHDSKAFIDLVPEIDRSELPIPAMAVKVTGFAGGGVAVGVAVHHAVVDGNGTMRFLEAWSAACRGEEDGVGGGVAVHDRAVIRHPRGDEIARMFLRKKAPHLPKMAAHPLTIEDRLRLQRRTFILSSSAVQSLKQHITNGSDHPPSTFTTISAYAWLCMAHTSPADVTNLLFLVDCRSRLHPPITDAYTGNCVRSCHATAARSDLLGPRGLARSQAEIARAVKEGSRDPFEGCETWVESFKQIPQAGRVLISGSHRFSSSQTDFGWGKAGRMELVSMNLDGEVLLDGRGAGSVQVSVALDPVRMGFFAEAFENLVMKMGDEETMRMQSSQQHEPLVDMGRDFLAPINCPAM